jgi:hypothetical protein
MSIRWIRNVTVDGRQTTLEVMLGATKIADKCYVRLNQEEEYWFKPTQENREAILEEGIEMLRNRLKGKTVLESNGSDFLWH